MDDNELFFAIAALMFLAWIISKALRAKRRKGDGPEPLCRCEHFYSFHDPQTGRCSRTRKISSKWDSMGMAVGYEYIPCECHVYDGPIPALNPQIMRELTNPSPSVEPYSQDK